MLTFLKYEFKQNWKDFLLSYILVIIAFAFLSIFTLCIRNVYNPSPFIIIVFNNLLFLVIATMIASAVLFIINVVKGCYTKIFTDEGYLTLSFPKSTHALILSKIIANVIWAVFFIISIFIGSVFVFLSVGNSVNEIFDDIRTIIEDVLSEAYLIPFEMINGLLGLIFNLIILLLSFSLINVGKIKKAKVFIGILFYIGISSILTSILSLTNLFGFGFAVNIDGELVFNYGSVFSSSFSNCPNGYLFNFTTIIFLLLFIVGGYFLTHYLISKKLELE